MGTIAEVLLVMRFFFLGLLLWPFLSTNAASVVAEDYQQFWLWAAVKPQPVLKQAQQLYIHQGLITRLRHQTRFQPQGIAIPRLKTPTIWLTYRVETLDWPDSIYQQIKQQARRWESAGNHITGIQIDFDANTLKLKDYQAFLTKLRQQLPSAYQLSITGLLDWSSNTSPEQLSALIGVVDEVVIQTYQGRQTIPDYQRYVERLRDFPIPFKIGLVQGGKWLPPSTLEAATHFQGYVIFLINRAVNAKTAAAQSYSETHEIRDDQATPPHQLTANRPLLTAPVHRLATDSA